MTTISYNLLIYDQSLTPDLYTKIKDSNINNTCIKNRILKIDDTLLVKRISYESQDFNNKSEIFLIKEYLQSKFSSPYFLNYYAIILIDDNIQSNVFPENYKDNSYTILDKYKKNISPIMRWINHSKMSCNLLSGNMGIIMPKYEPLNKYLKRHSDLDVNLLLKNIIGILELSILIRDKYELIHCDVKIDNIVVNDNIFYLIDWENAFNTDEIYLHQTRPTNGNTEMYPFYDATAEQFFIYSIGVLIVRIIGYHYGVTYLDFVDNLNIIYILSKIPYEHSKKYDLIVLDICKKKIKKIEVLKDKITEIIENSK